MTLPARRACLQAALACALSPLGTACTAATMPSDNAAADATALPIELRLRMGHREFAPGQASRAQLLQACAEANQRDRLATPAGLPALPAELDIGLRDEAKLLAFVDGWARVPAAERGALAGLVLQLDAPELKLMAHSAVPVAQLRQGFGLALTHPVSAGRQPRAALVAPADLALARQRADLASRTLNALQQALQARPASPQDAAGLRDRAALQNQAASVAMVWRAMVAELREARPQDPALAAEAAQADQAVSRHRVNAPPQGGMPGGRPGGAPGR
jgi:hypothetical protein